MDRKNAVAKHYPLAGNVPLKKLRRLVREIESRTNIQLLGTEAALFFNARERLIREGCY
jgi:hypothetical protein